MSETHAIWCQRIERICRLIEERLDEDIPLEELADAVHASMFHMHRVFRGITGETVRTYARRLRLERAAYHLIQRDDSILGIALDAGYDSHEAFTRAFARQFDMTPSAYRESGRDQRPIHSPSRDARTMDIRIETVDPCTVAFVRHVGSYGDTGRAWATLMRWGWSKMIFGRPTTFGMSHDDPDVTPADRLRYDACLVAKPGTKTKGEISLRELPGGAFAVTEHRGSFELIGETYSGLFATVAISPVDGRRWMLGDPPAREVYLTDPRTVEPTAMRTEIWMPVAPAG